MNTNCLEGYKCPSCGREDKLLVYASMWVAVMDDGTDPHDDSLDMKGGTEYDDDSNAECPGCRFAAKLKDFEIISPESGAAEGPVNKTIVAEIHEAEDARCLKVAQEVIDRTPPAEEAALREGASEIASPYSERTPAETIAAIMEKPESVRHDILMQVISTNVRLDEIGYSMELLDEWRKEGTMTYQALRSKHQKEIGDFPMVFAFDNEQLEAGLKKLGASKDECVSLGAGGIIRKSDQQALVALYTRQEKEQKEALQDDAVLKEALLYELANHEYGYTHDAGDALAAVGVSLKDERVARIFKEAEAEYFMTESA
jgi:rubredoxin